MASPANLTDLSASTTKNQATSASTRPMQAVLTLSTLFFLARFTGLLQRQIISALLPTAATEAYSVAFGLPDLLNYMVAGGAISLTFIPIFTKFWNRGREAEAWRFFSTLASVVGAALAVLTALMILWTPQLLLLLFPGLIEPEKSETYQLAIQMTRIILPAQLFFYLGGLLVGVLNTFKRFGATGWTSALNNLVAIVVGISFLPFFGPVGFAWGILLGAFCGNFMLPLLAAQRAPRAQRPRFTVRFSLADPAVRRFIALTLPIIFGVSLPVVDQFIVRYFASSLPLGTLTFLENANRLMIAAQGVLGQAAAVAAFPYLAGESASGDYRAFSEFLRSGLRRLLFVALPVSTLLLLWAAPITRLLYGYGQFNNPEKLRETALYFALYSIGIFAWVGQGLVARGFYALGDTRTPTIIGSALTLFFFIPLCAFMAHFNGAAGLAFATTIGAAIYFLSVLILLDKKLSKSPYKSPLGLDKIGGTLLRTGAACSLMGLAGVLSLHLMFGIVANNKVGDLELIAWSGAVAIFVFSASATRFEIAEWSWLRSKILRRRRA
ncbi:putative peptidoglycan lipid II flippase [Abditibacterium utsteinense]|uniref:Probable lipid II flippase MurJ n=1 Tax=Abditibacterium utsteinense TaxID=1960156 RepID=A0A2S8ST75_9BACT|nr:murein biosynthesis integral membrane protein MurJ [Abditibacterium utsteinense]PQV64001.1 putative peptidoglycan lipid II flippase [Abditibacterium utsteinense]